MKHIYLSSCRSRRYQGVRCQGSHRLTAAKPRPSVSDNWNRVVKPSNSSGMIPRNLDNSYVLTLNPISSVTMPLSIGTNYHNQLPVSSSLDTPVASSHPAVSWLSQDDDILFTARSQGHGWGQIQRQHFPSKTPNACRKRYERLIAKKRGTEWDQERLDRLRMRYRELRERTWKPLADATGERWQDVEKACFERGLKFLLSTSRSSRAEVVERKDAVAPDDNGETHHHSRNSGTQAGKITVLAVNDLLT